MGTRSTRVRRAARLHRLAAATLAGAAVALNRAEADAAAEGTTRDVVDRLRASATAVAPGWLGSSWPQLGSSPVPGDRAPSFVRLGSCDGLPADDCPALVPLIGAAHLTLDADVRDRRVRGLLRALMLRVLASAPSGTVLLRCLDGIGVGEAFEPFQGLTAIGLVAPPMVGHQGLRTLLDEGEHWVRGATASAIGVGRRNSVLLAVVASLPATVPSADVARLVALADRGPATGLHLIVAGWPPSTVAEPYSPDQRAYSDQPQGARPAIPGLPYASTLRLLAGRDDGGPILDVVDGARPGRPDGRTTSIPLTLDTEPPAHLIQHACRQLLALSAPRRRATLSDLLINQVSEREPNGLDGVTAVVGIAERGPVWLCFNDLTPHWLVGGRSRTDRLAFLTGLAYAIAARHRPDVVQIDVLMVEPGPAGPPSASPVTESAGARAAVNPLGLLSLPHVRRFRRADPVASLQALTALAAVLSARGSGSPQPRTRRPVRVGSGQSPESAPALLGHPNGATTSAAPSPSRSICVIDGFTRLLTIDDPWATEAVVRLQTLAALGRAHGVHLILSGDESPPGSCRLTPTLQQIRVRIALAGGGHVLEPGNDAASALAPGSAIVNTAGGLGGPRNAVRGHERLVRFPDVDIELGAVRTGWELLRVQRQNETGEATAEPPVRRTGAGP